MAFSQFKQVGQAQVPNLIAAQAADDRMDAANKAREIAMKGKLAQGGVGLYNEAMGDSTPIADYLGLSEPTGQFAMEDMNYALPEASGITSGINGGALAEALRAPEMATAAGDFGMTADLLGGLAVPEAAGTFNLGTALAPEAAAAIPEGIAALSAPLAELGLAAPAATAGMNASAIGGALAPAAAEIGVGAGLTGAAGAALPPLGIAMALGSLFGLFG